MTISDYELDSSFVVNNTDIPIIDEDIESVNQSALLYIRKNYLALAIFFLVVVLVFAWFSLAFRVYNLMFIPIGLFFLAYGFIQKNIRHAFMQQFAKTNNFSYQRWDSIAFYPAPYLDIGYDRTVEDVVSGEYLGLPVKFFTFSCKKGYGKNKQTISFTVCEIHYKCNLPRIFLDAHHRNIFTNGPSPKLQGEEIISLEGDFNKYFTLYVPRGYAIEALQIFAPDVMAKLIDKSKKFDLEFTGDHLYIYSSSVISTKEDLYSMFDLAKILTMELAPVLERLDVPVYQKKY
ncbi:MAG: hypothetical protein WC858_04355 [Parcubacteria group bacterium]|jgi:hypothetical protein